MTIQPTIAVVKEEHLYSIWKNGYSQIQPEWKNGMDLILKIIRCILILKHFK